jgi:hypothetical protein
MKKILYILFIPLLFSCSNKAPELNIELIRQAHLSDLPSASGIEYTNGITYLVGDDMRWLVALDDTWNVTGKMALSAIDTLANNRTPWNVKADFESIAAFNFEDKKYLLVLSSGSMLDTRDTAHLVQFADSLTFFKKNIRTLYEDIKLLAGIPDSNEINIEGLAISNTSAYLFHRGNVYENFIAEIQLDALMNYLLSGNDAVPAIKIHTIHLPTYNEIPSGLSGACMLPDQSAILYTASLEDTDSELYDGEILGSFIGYIPLDKLQEGISYTSLLKDKNELPINKKLESIVIKSGSDNKMLILSVSDNDDGSSDIFEMNIYLNNLD